MSSDMTEPNATDRDLMEKARAKRDQMIADKAQCCINCAWATLRPAFTHQDPDWFAAHYVQCRWPRMHPQYIPSSVSRAPREAADDPTMQHMAGTECPTFQAKT